MAVCTNGPGELCDREFGCMAVCSGSRRMFFSECTYVCLALASEYHTGSILFCYLRTCLFV